MTACIAPEFSQKYPIRQLEDLAGLPMLQLESRPSVWLDWFEGQGAAPYATGGMLMDQYSMMIQSAISGLGVALLPDYLAQIEISEGRLVPVLKTNVPVRGAYWLVWPKDKVDHAPLKTFRGWLGEQTDAILHGVEC
jgi:LysR family glycine cleavage system transcriptional activator